MLFFLLICSFFVVEDTILHTTQSLGTREGGDESLVTRKIVNEFWSMAQDETLAVLRSNCVSKHILFRSEMASNLLPKWFLSLFPISHFKQSFAMLPEGYFINLISDTIIVLWSFVVGEICQCLTIAEFLFRLLPTLENQAVCGLVL